jgi:hypothetical protein
MARPSYRWRAAGRTDRGGRSLPREPGRGEPCVPGSDRSERLDVPGPRYALRVPYPPGALRERGDPTRGGCALSGRRTDRSRNHEHARPRKTVSRSLHHSGRGWTRSHSILREGPSGEPAHRIDRSRTARGDPTRGRTAIAIRATGEPLGIRAAFPRTDDDCSSTTGSLELRPLVAAAAGRRTEPAGGTDLVLAVERVPPASAAPDMNDLPASAGGRAFPHDDPFLP